MSDTLQQEKFKRCIKLHTNKTSVKTNYIRYTIEKCIKLHNNRY